MTVQIVNLEAYIEDIYYPQPAKKVSQVIDILTDQIEIPLLIEDSFLNLKIYAKNLYNKEIPFLEREDKIFLNLNPIDSFPLVFEGFKYQDMINNKRNLRHVKLDIRYLLIHSKISGTWYKKLSTVSFSYIPREIHITSPLGCRISGGTQEGFQVGLRLIRKSKNDKNQSIIDKDDLFLHKPFICEKLGKRVYNYLITAESYNEGYNKIEEKPTAFTVQFAYFSNIEPMVLIISLLIPFLFLCFSIAIIMAKLNFIQFSITDTPSNSISFLILLMSYFYFHQSYIKEGRYIPHRNLFNIIFIISFLASIIWAFSSPDLPDLSQIANVSNVSQIANMAELYPF